MRDNGTEISMALNAERGSAAATFRYYAEATDKVHGQIAPTADIILALIHRESAATIRLIWLAGISCRSGSRIALPMLTTAC